MDVRIAVRELPPRPTGDEPLYYLVWRAGRKQGRHPLAEGEIIVGTSRENPVSIEAAGVRGRHLRLKRHGPHIFIQPLNKARVLKNGEAFEGFVRLSLNEPFTFGAVKAAVERVDSEDLRAAVQIEPAGPSPLTEEGEGRISAFPVQQLKKLNEALQRADQALDYSLLLETLSGCIAPVAAALFRRCQTGDWLLLAEVTAGRGAPALRPEEPGEHSRFSLRAGEQEYLLLIQFASESNEAWQQEVCRHILLQASFCERNLHSAAAVAGAGAGAPKSSRVSAPAAASHAAGVTAESGTSEDVWRGFVGSSIRARLAASTDICRYSDTVLLLGETGTGKELASQALHRLWGRRGSLVAINCAAIPAELLDAELFGIEAGAATGVTARPGRIREAEGGTLFLDEISELPLNLQTKLLRMLQEREYFSIGGAVLQRADVKIVAASNQSAAYLQAGHMRDDLYYRLSQATLTLPPLREVTEDLAALCAHFLVLLETQFGRWVKGISISALDRLKTYAWPGNVRELQNLLRYLYATAPPNGLIHSRLLPEQFHAKPPIRRDGTLAAVVKAAKREAIERALLRHANNRDAARSLGLSESYLYRMLRKLGLSRPADGRRNLDQPGRGKGR